jgi:SAM-dependent methyltransferase
MSAARTRSAVLDAWRPRLRHLLDGEQIVATAAEGTAAAGFEHGWPTTPDILVLRALAYDDELRNGLVEAGLSPARNILDAGCGPGMITRVLAQISGGDVIGVDIEPALLAFAEDLPAPERGSVSFQQGDVLAGLPFADGTFDAVFVGDMWLPGMLAELRRITRPGGRVVMKLIDVLPTLTYPWDRAFELRMQLALVEASRRCFGDDDHSDGASARRGQVARAARWQQLRAFSVLIERFAPVPDVFEEVERQVFARYSGPLLKDAVEADDWSTLTGLWDPAADGYLFRRPDVHIMRSLHFLTAQLPS